MLTSNDLFELLKNAPNGLAKLELLGRARINNKLTLNGALDISAADAGQIKFPATQNPSSDANTLDDYEEGAWTPIDSSGAALSLTVSGEYEKIGRMVRASANIIYPVTVDVSSAIIGGLPFSIKNSEGARTGNVAYSNVGGFITSLGVKNTTTAGIYDASGAAVLNSALSAKSLYVQFVYPAL